MCKTLRCLPQAGGLLDQDSYAIHLLKAGLAGLAEKERVDTEKAKAKAKAAKH